MIFIHKITQPIHILIAPLLIKTNCIDRGCAKYHGSSPSQLFQFYNAPGLDKIQEGFK